MSRPTKRNIIPLFILQVFSVYLQIRYKDWTYKLQLFNFGRNKTSKQFKRNNRLICVLQIQSWSRKNARNCIFVDYWNIQNQKKCKCTEHASILKLQMNKKLKWSNQAIFTFLRSAANIVLMQMLGEFNELRGNILEKGESIVGCIKEHTAEEKICKIIR